MLVLFDIDDTLIDHSAAVRDGVSELFGRIQSPLRLEEFLASWVVAMKEHYPRYLSGAVTYEDQRRARIRQTVGPQLSDQQADELFAIYFQTYAASWAVFPDVLPCLDALEDHRLGIISNGQGAEQRSKLQLTGIVDRFEFIHISAECGCAKPAAAIFHHACEMAGAPAREAVYVGDLYYIDAVGARDSGLNGVWLDRQHARAVSHAPPIIGGLAELGDVLRSCTA